MPKIAVYNRSQFKPFADALIEFCARNAVRVGIFNDDDLRTIVQVEQIHNAFRLWWENQHLHINQAAFHYLQKRGARFSVPVLLQ